jgi:hypothetical protein
MELSNISISLSSLYQTNSYLPRKFFGYGCGTCPGNSIGASVHYFIERQIELSRKNVQNKMLGCAT